MKTVGFPSAGAPLLAAAAIAVTRSCVPGPIAQADPGELERLLGEPTATAGNPGSRDTSPGPGDDEPTPASSPRPSRVIEEVVVTAQKTEQRLQDVPLSIQVLQGDDLEEKGIFDMKGVEGYVPNVRVEPDPTAPTLTVRGIGTFGANLFEPSVGIVVDEVALARPPFLLDALFDIERLEVLRGPQGTLFGKNTPAGVFNIVTAEPTDEVMASIGGYVGTLGEERVHGAVSGPLTETLSVRLAGLYSDRDDFVYNTTLDREEEVGSRYAGRAKMRWRPFDRLELDASALRANNELNYWAFQTSDLEPATRDYLDDFDPRIEDDPLNFRTSLDFVGKSEIDTDILNGRGSYLLGDLWAFSDLELVTVLSRSGMSFVADFDLDASPADLLPFLSDVDYDQDTVELRLGGRAPGFFGRDDSLEFVVGAYLFRSGSVSDLTFVGGADLPSYLATEDALETVTGQDETVPPGPAVRDQVTEALGIEPVDFSPGEDDVTLFLDQTSASESLFGQMTWHATSRLALTGGVRFNHERKEGFFRNTARGGFTAALLQIEEFETRERRRENDVSPKASLQYDWTDDLTTFFTWAKGFKGGGFNAVVFTADDVEFGPETSQSFDLGLKTTLLDETLQLNAALFRTSFDDLQVQIFDGTRIFVINAASAISRGIEGDFFWLSPWPPLSLTGSAGWIDARYGDGSTGPAPVFSEERTTDLGGKPLMLAPELTGALSPTLDFPTGLPFGLDPARISLTLDVLYTGHQFLDADADPNVAQPGYVQFHLRGGLSSADERWSIRLAAKNLGNERFETIANDTVLFPGTYMSRQGWGRSIGVEVASRW